MSDENKTAETNSNGTPLAATLEKKARAVKVGDTVHLVHHEGALGGATRFTLAHAEAEVTKVHKKGQCIDLIVPNADPAKAIEITSCMRDDAADKPDTWHFPEAAE